MKLRVFLGLLSCLVIGNLRAQPGMPGPGNGAFNSSLIKMFGDIKAFSAQADAQMRDKSNAEFMSTPINFALLNGKMRMELDLMQMKNKQLPPEAMNSMKQMGMDRMVNIVIPDQNKMIMIYPTLNAHAEMPIPQEQGSKPGQDVQIEKTVIGRENVDGHPCNKTKMVLTDSSGKKHEGIVWNATDLKDFPIKMEFGDKEATVTMTYKNIKMTPPDASLFEPPTGSTKYNSIQQLMQAAMQKMMAAPK